MKRGDFAKEYSKYKKGGGELTRSEWAKVWWPQVKESLKEAEAQTMEVKKDGEVSSGGEVPSN